MYAVVGCSDCDALWIVEGHPETTGCPRCGRRHRFRTLRRFAETEAEDAAREARAALLAERGGHGEAFAELDTFAEMEAYLDDVGPDDAGYLEGSGIDPAEVEAAGERAGMGRGRDGGRSRKETVRGALRELDRPTGEEVTDYAEERGVPPEAARDLLDRMIRAGEATESGGRYRPL